MLRNEKSINYSLVKEIADYLCNYSEKTHHPKEDLIYLYYIEHYGAQHKVENQEMQNLEEEHIALSKKSHEFLDIVNMILRDAVVPQDVFIAQLESLIKAQKSHLDCEEKEILPLINDTFSAQDWLVVESQWEQPEDDPVFGANIADQYKQLAKRVRQKDTDEL